MSQDKTEKPTAKRKAKARREGNVARSPELAQWFTVLALSMLIGPLVRYQVHAWQVIMTGCLQATRNPSPELALDLLGSAMRQTFFTLVEFAGGVLFIGAALAIAQGGLHFATKRLQPNFKALNPLAGIKRQFSVNKLWDMAKMLAKVAVVALVCWLVIHQVMPMVGVLMPMQSVVDIVGSKADSLLRYIGLLSLLIAGGDYAFTRYRHRKGMMMSKTEVKDEHRQSEGDPLIRSAIRSRQMAAARRRMFADVPTADVLLVNPTHYAVALKYDPAFGAPRVVAKGAGFVAQRIRDIAAEHELATVQDVELTRALFRSCDVGHEIPAELFAAVAQVLAFVITRRRRGMHGGEHETPRTGEQLPEVPAAAQRRRRRSAAETLLDDADAADTSGRAAARR